MAATPRHPPTAAQPHRQPARPTVDLGRRDGIDVLAPPRGDAAPIPLSAYEYYGHACARCGGAVPPREPVVHDVWEHPKRVYCSPWCLHAHHETWTYRNKPWVIGTGTDAQRIPASEGGGLRGR